jgi:6-phosphogluconolactonase/glucosamine-6-phosphate isomerase/deaminase
MVYVNYLCVKPAGHPNTLHQKVLKFASSLGIKVVAPDPNPNPTGDGSAEAAFYRDALKAVGLRKEPLDLVLLDLGLDGKVGGLHPNSPAALSNKYSIVGSKGNPGPLTTTMTLPMLNGAGRCVVVCSGVGSALAVARALNGRDPKGAFPAHGLCSPLYLLDADAASAL